MSETVTPQTGQMGTTGAQPGLHDKAGEVAGTAKDQASEVVGTAKQQAAGVAQAAGEQVRTVADDARHQARQLVDNSRQQLHEQATQQTERAASSLRTLGQQLQRMASGQPVEAGPAQDFARQAGEVVQRFADSLQSKQPEELLTDVKRFARQRPGMFLAGALGAGFLAGRLMRTVDTESIKDAAKEGMGMSTGDELVSGPGAVGAGPMSTMPTGGTTPADLIDPAPAGIIDRPARTEPLRATPLDSGLGTGSEL